MMLQNYKHIEYCHKPNKNKIPINHFTFEDLDEFNKIYLYAKEHYKLVKPTKSQGISVKISERFFERYFIINGNQRFEMVIICYEGCYRFLLHNKKAIDNTISGQQACRSIYNWADNYGIDLSKYIVDNGKDIKKEIESPHIKVLQPLLLGKKLSHVYHLDLRSSYASRICETYPELKEMYEDIFNHRKENNGYYKHVLTNSIGCWQSPYCVDYKNRHATVPYQFANLSKIAINGTRQMIEKYIEILKRRGMMPILTNTDGIWYVSDNGPYHSRNEGDGLCNYQNDHLDCEFLMTSAGAYQYVENGICKSVVRGLCDLDVNEPDRDKWKFGDIKNMNGVYKYKFNENEGVKKILWQENITCLLD